MGRTLGAATRPHEPEGEREKLSRKNPPHNPPSRNSLTATRARLCVPLCLAAAAALCPFASYAHTQGQSPEQTPAVVRPRTVRPKEDAARPVPTPTQGVAAPAPAQTNAAPAPSAQPDTTQADEA